MNELERLRERVSELENILALRIDLPSVLGLTVTEKKIVGLLTSRDIINEDAMYSALYAGRPDCDQPDPQIIKVYLVKIRRKLRPHGIEIKNHYSVGYYIEKEGRAKLKEMAAAKSAFNSRLLSDLQPLTRQGAAA